jgi:hypothetical protein
VKYNIDEKVTLIRGSEKAGRFVKKYLVLFSFSWIDVCVSIGGVLTEEASGISVVGLQSNKYIICHQFWK